MTYAEAVAHLHALGPELAPVALADGSFAAPRRKFNLAHMHTLCAALGDPQRSFPSILIAGTNGKGSTAATLAAMLTAAGYRTGLYTSPHLVRVNERIQAAQPVLPSEYGSVFTHGTDGALALREIPDDVFARLYTEVDAACTALVAADQLPVLPSFFERLTALAFLFFAGSDTVARAEIVVLDVGLGGRLDATNVVDPLLSVITDIALDHQEYLGSTLAEIAREKAGILRAGGTLVTLSQHPEANQAIGLVATELAVTGVNAGDFLPPASRNSSAPAHQPPAQEPAPAGSPLPRNRYTVNFGGEPLQVDSPLPGQHQQRNLALALAAALQLRNHHGYNLSVAALAQGICDTRWPGRLEFLPPNLLLDVAHNPAGAWPLRAALGPLPEFPPRTLIFSCLRDKSLQEMSRILFPLFDSSPDGNPLRRHDHILLAPIDSPRAAAVEDLLAAAHALGTPAHAAPHLAAALAQAREITPPGGIIVATGSVYLVGEVRALTGAAA